MSLTAQFSQPSPFVGKGTDPKKLQANKEMVCLFIRLLVGTKDISRGNRFSIKKAPTMHDLITAFQRNEEVVFMLESRSGQTINASVLPVLIGPNRSFNGGINYAISLFGLVDFNENIRRYRNCKCFVEFTPPDSSPVFTGNLFLNVDEN